METRPSRQAAAWAKKVGIDTRFHPRWSVGIRLPAAPKGELSLSVAWDSWRLAFRCQRKESWFASHGNELPWTQILRGRGDQWGLAGRKKAYRSGIVLAWLPYRLPAIEKLVSKLEREHGIRFARDQAGIRATGPAGTKAKVQAWLRSIR